MAQDEIIQMTENPYDLKLKLVCKENIHRMVEYLWKGRSFPISMEIMPTNRCNLNCSWCIDQQYRNDEELKIEALKEFHIDYKRLGGESITYSGGGEPGIYPHIEEAINHAHNMSLDLGMMSNGAFPSVITDTIGKKLKWIRISLDTSDRQLYKKMKGADMLNKVRENISVLSTYPIKVNVNVNLNKLNEHTVLKTAEDAKEWGADVFQLRPVLPCPAEKSTYVPLDLQELVGQLKALQDKQFFISVSYDKFNEVLKPRTYDSCRYHNFIFILNANGDVNVCAYRLYEKDFTFGNIYKNTLPEIWNSERWMQVIRNTKGMDFSKCQVCCKGHELNKYLHALHLANQLKDRRFL